MNKLILFRRQSNLDLRSGNVVKFKLIKLIQYIFILIVRPKFKFHILIDEYTNGIQINKFTRVKTIYMRKY